ncbi:IQ domain-containing protein D [Fasciola hepatica]|uniref:Dynein regulatory complex protein 10 n=1 Tax=Fasciola hepatica TaxID=6192 RepID=A0A4E0S2M1_FASHE|nr:IQ domain-containing protein D [Fasciola hepatica]
MTAEPRKYSANSESDERLRRPSIMSPLPLLANAPTIQKLSLKHLPTIDSKRFMKVLDNTVTRVLLVSSFPRIVSNISEFSLLLGRNATVLFETYGPLSKAYDEQCNQSRIRPRLTDREAMDQQRASFITFDDGTSVGSDKLTASNRVKPQVTSRLFEVTRLLLREMMNNPLAISALIRHREQWAIEPSASCRRLAVQLVHLRSLTRNDLLTTPKARARRDEFLDRLRRRDAEQKRMIEDLSKQFQALQESQKSQLLERMERARDLQTKIREIQEKTQNELIHLKQQYDTERRLTRQKHQESVRAMESFLNASKIQLKKLIERNIDYEQKTRLEKWKMEDEISGMLAKADTEMFEMQAELDTRTVEEQKESEECAVLMEKLEPLKILADAVLEKKRIEAEQQAAQLQEQENMIRAATTIQSLWRSWRARKLIKAERRQRKKNKAA